MSNNFTMILWMKPVEETFENQMERVYGTLREISQIDTLYPRFLPAKTKKLAKEFILSKGNTRELVQINHDKLFPELGSRFSFFTSMNDDEMNGISISTGNQKFTNSIVIKIKSSDFFIKGYEKLLQMVPLFIRIVKMNNPFFACIADRRNESMYEGYFNEEKQQPKAVYWMNYWGKDIVSQIGFEQAYRNEELSKVYNIEEFNGGYFINLTKEPTNFENDEHMELQKSINLMLRL